MRTITALFVGLGSIGTRHLKNLTNLCADRGWTLQADALRSDLSRPLRDGVAALLHAQYTDLADAPAHYDMVFITNPTSLHADALTRVRGRGGALFIEKPIFSAEQTGLDLADCLPAGQKAYVAAPMRWCGKEAFGSPIFAQLIIPPLMTNLGLVPKNAGSHNTRSAILPFSTDPNTSEKP